MKLISILGITQAIRHDLFSDTQVLAEVNKHQGYFLSERNDSLKYNSTKYVHIFPHSHTDLGWLNTLEESFTGKASNPKKNQMSFKGSVDGMLTSVIKNLENDPKKTFSYAEMKFFKMWWNQQDDQKKASVRKLI